MPRPVRSEFHVHPILFHVLLGILTMIVFVLIVALARL